MWQASPYMQAALISFPFSSRGRECTFLPSIICGPSKIIMYKLGCSRCIEFSMLPANAMARLGQMILQALYSLWRTQSPLGLSHLWPGLLEQSPPVLLTLWVLVCCVIICLHIKWNNLYREETDNLICICKTILSFPMQSPMWFVLTASPNSSCPWPESSVLSGLFLEASN